LLAIALDTHALALPLPDPAARTALVLDGQRDALRLEARELALPDGPFTIEGWLKAKQRFTRREGFICKTESSEYGLFVGEGKPDFTVFLDGKYAHALSEQAILPVDAWCHVAGVFDGQELRLYVDGRLVATTPATGKRKPNALPL